MQINLNLSQIKHIIGAEIGSDDSFLVKNITSLENAQESDLAVVLDRGSDSVFSPVALDKIKNSKAGIILSEKEFVEGKKYLLTQDSLIAFSKIIDFVNKNSNNNLQKISAQTFIDDKTQIHDTVIVGPYSVILDNSKIDENSIIESNVFIGKNVTIGKNSFIYSGARILDGSIIGNNCIIHANAVIGSDGFGYNVSKTGLNKIPQIGIVKIGNNVEIGACATIDRASFEATIISDGCKIDNQVHIAHNVIIGPHTVILAQTGIAGSVQIGFGCQIGGQVAIRDHIKIGNNVKIVSTSGVMNNVVDNETVAGIPAVKFSEWKRLIVIFAKLPEYLKIFKERDKKRTFWSKFFK